MSETQTPIPVEEATSLDIPGEWDDILHVYTGGAWTWADPIYAGASDSMKWRTWADFDNRGKARTSCESRRT
jgi:hypothetical protein